MRGAVNGIASSLSSCAEGPRSVPQASNEVGTSRLWCNQSSINKEDNETPHERLFYAVGVGRWTGAARTPGAGTAEATQYRGHHGGRCRHLEHWRLPSRHDGRAYTNLDKLANEGMLFTDYYAEASCTAGRANFITGELPIRTGMTTVGQAGSPIGLPAKAATIATVLKSMGYATGQF